jgi:ABC-type uncharacterized transport system YnjBCD ATPase subunit
VSAAEVARTLVQALEAAAGSGASLVSAEVSMLAAEPLARVDTAITRRTKTLIFARAQAIGASGAAVAEASSVHKAPPPSS